MKRWEADGVGSGGVMMPTIRAARFSRDANHLSAVLPAILMSCFSIFLR